MKPIKEQQLYLGVDGGGTKCKAIVTDEDLNVLGSGISGPANPYRDMSLARQSIFESALLALKDAGIATSDMDQVVAGMGLAGVNVASTLNEFNTWDHPFKQMHVTTDLHVAVYGAHQEDKGAVIITGTGSSAIACVGDFTAIHGGHGFPHGDIASGAWIGMEGVKRTLLALDKVAPVTTMTDTILAHVGGDKATDIVSHLRGAKATEYGQFTPLVFDAAEAGDVIAKDIIQMAAEYVERMAQRLWEYDPGRLCIVGGTSARLKTWLNAQTQALLSEQLASAEVGAAWFAKRSYTNSK